MKRTAWIGLLLLGAIGPLAAQEPADSPAAVEQVYVPQEAFDRVLQRYPEGVLVRQDELQELLRRAGRRPAPAQEEAAAPLPTSIEGVQISGKVQDGVASLHAEAQVSLLTDTVVLLELPLQGLGLTRLTVDGQDGRLIRTRGGAAVLLQGAPRQQGRIVPTTRAVAWEFAVRVEPGDERGSGQVSFPVPAAASGKVSLDVDGDVEVSAQGGLAWVAQPGQARTQVTGAFGGTAAGQSTYQLSWRPRRAVLQVTPYVVADTRGVYLIRQGVVTLESTVRIGVYRALRDSFDFDLPPGFVVSELATDQGELTYAQQGDRVQARLSAPRDGLLEFRLRAELPTDSGGEAQELELRPLRLPGVDRVSGLLGLAHGEGSVVRFEQVQDLDQEDLDRLGSNAAGDSLLRVYGHYGDQGSLKVQVEPLRPKVDLDIKAAFQLEDREVGALAAYRFVVREGKVYTLRVSLPPEYELDQVVLRDQSRREPQHELRHLVSDETPPRQELAIELQNGLRAGQELLVTVQAHRGLDTSLAGGELAVPALSGAPASRVSGYLGFAPDEAFRLKSARLDALTAIPAEELPRAGLDVPGLVLGYRIEEAGYAGRVLVERRSTRVSARTLVRQYVLERILRTDANLDLEVEGAPVQAVELLLPEGIERQVHISGADARWEDRERLGVAEDGRVRWRLPFESRKSGLVSLRVQFETKLPVRDGEAVEVEALPKVSLADAFRERGTLAIYSAGTTELEPHPQGVRPIEVTEVQAADDDGQRPLFAYTYVGQGYQVGLGIQRHPAAEILSAVAERLSLVTTADADGLTRHTATFQVKNLDNQFFAIRLPEGADLWSVVVDGTGVKPAERNGLRIVPIAHAGAKGADEATTVTATYTLSRQAWGNMGDLQLVAPELLLDEDHTVPVLQTRWELALPEDYRVLEYGGNLHTDRGGVGVAPLFTARLWRLIKQEHAEWLLLPLLGFLALAASARARGWLLALLAGLGGAASDAGRRARGLRVPRKAKIGVAIGAGVVLLGYFVLSSRGMMRPTAMKDAAVYQETARAPRPMASPAESPGADAYYGYPQSEAAPAEGGATLGVPQGAAEGNWAEGGEAAGAAPRSVPMPPPAAKPAPVQAPQRQRAAGKKQGRRSRRDANALDDAVQGPMNAEPMDMEADEDFAEAESLEEERPMAQEPMAPPPPMDAPAQPKAPMEEPLADRKLEAVDTLEAKERKDEGLAHLLAKTKSDAQTIQADMLSSEDARVGLRSLVLSLAPVGQESAFSRPGGGARLSLSFVKESVLSTSGGALALLGFLLAFALPRSRRLGYLGLVLVGLAALTALPLVALPTKLIPLLNALAFGILLAAPAHAALGVFGWLGTRPVHRLRQAVTARHQARRGAPSSGAAAAVILLAMLGLAQPASAQEAQADTSARPRVYVPYDPSNPDRIPDRVYVPGEVYQELWKRAFPEQAAAVKPKPPAATVITRADYTGRVQPGQLSLQVSVQVDVLAEGWQRCPLGLAGVGLNSSSVEGTRPDARVTVAPAGGFDLVAQGPGSYRVTLDVKAPQRGDGYTFATVPALAAQLDVTSTLEGRRVVVGGAKAQVEREQADGSLQVSASLGDAARVQLSFPGRSVLTSGGASEASATTRSVAWTRPGRVLLVSATEFAVSGAGREGFVFQVPAGLEVLAVQTPSLRDWQVGEGRLEVRLRHPSGARHVVQVWAEALLPRGASGFQVPQLQAQGVSRESGSLGLAADEGIRLRATPGVNVTQDQGSDLRGLAAALSRASRTQVRIDRAFRFSRRPSELSVELVHEPAEVKADVVTAASFLADRTQVRTRVSYDVRRGTVYQLELAVPADLELTGGPTGLDVREVSVSEPRDGARIYRLGLAKGLSGSAQIELVFERRHVLTEALQLGFPDVRPLDVAYETGTLGLAVAPGLRLSVRTDPTGLSSTNPRGAVRQLRAPPGGAEWTLAYRRANGRTPGLAQGRVELRRPAAEVTGSWVLHAHVERDVVRYVLRALYTIENAGARRFQVRIPGALGDRYAVQATNLREYRGAQGEGDSQVVTVDLQSPAEGFYDLAVSWEEVLQQGQPFQLPQVGIEGVDRLGRGYVLVEKAPQVSDLLRQQSMTGAVEPGRAADAPALPPGRSPKDFAFVYQVLLKGSQPWSVTCSLEAPGALRMPAPARIPYAHVTSVFTGQGRARHRAVYRVRNQRLQFLALDLPRTNGVPAEVWSVTVAGQPKRPHQQARGDGQPPLLLVPLPKRTDADLSFDVEVIYSTPLPGELGFGGRLTPQAPALATKGVEVEHTFWSLYLPADYDYSGFDGNLQPASVADLQVQALAGQVQELKELEDIARNSRGNTQEVANGNVQVQLDRIEQQLATCQSQVNAGSGKAWKELGSNQSDVKRLRQMIDERVRQQEAQTRERAQQQADVQQVQVEGQNFQQMDSGWYSNDATIKQNRVQWAGVPGEEQSGGGRQEQQESSWTLTVPEGLDLDLKNAEVFKDAQRQHGGSGGGGGGRGLLGNSNYANAYRQGQQAQAMREAQEQLQKNLGRNLIVTAEGDKLGRLSSSAGLISMRVAFETPGRAYHFVTTDSEEAPHLSVSSYPRRTAERGVTVAQGVVLLILLIGLFRLGLLATPVPGHRARQALLLIVGAALCVGVFANLALTGLAALLGLLAIRYGPALQGKLA